MSLEEVIAAAPADLLNRIAVAMTPAVPMGLVAEEDAARVFAAVREWLLADPQIKRGARAIEALGKGPHWHMDESRAALSAILESPNARETK